MERIRKFIDWLGLPPVQVAHHCQVSASALKCWIRGRWPLACKTPAEHCRVDLEELPRLLQQAGLLGCPGSAPYIRILIVNNKPAKVDLFIDLLTGDLQGFKLDTAGEGAVFHNQRGRQRDGLKAGNLSVAYARASWYD